jgi:asparagine synthetase B (glutamine-hydrolysing)
MNRALPTGDVEDPATPAQLLDVLTTALSIRTRTIPETHTYDTYSNKVTPRVAVLFSGGLDCSVIAWLIHTLLPPDEPIDLINVAFENPRTVAAQKTKAEDVYRVCPDRITGLAGWEELCRLSQGTSRNWRFVEVAALLNLTECHRLISHMKRLCVNERIS